MDLYQQFIHKSRYARWLPTQNRRENWDETVTRYIDYVRDKVGLPTDLSKELWTAIHNLEIMPSMRMMMTAGPALDRCHVAAYNCAYLPIDHPRAFDETLYILLCGTGVGFSVERQCINRLPEVPSEIFPTDTTIVVEDSKLGWAKAYKQLIHLLYSGEEPRWDLSKLRPSGARLKTFGGRASGPEPLERLFNFTVAKFKDAAGRRLSSLQVHDIICKIGEVVVVGGVRRSALLSLSNVSDDRMRAAKAGDWRHYEPQRQLANNSACYTERPGTGIFLDEWKSLYDSKSGERGIFNRAAAQRKAKETDRRDPNFEFGTNPCVTGETPVLTKRGWEPIQELVSKSVDIWNGEVWSKVKPFSTGVNPIYRVNLSNGLSLDCTPYHIFVLKNGSRVEAQALKEGDRLQKFSMPVIEPKDDVTKIDRKEAYSQGFYAGDGNQGYNFSWVYKPKEECLKDLLGEFKETDYGRHRWDFEPLYPKYFVPLNSHLAFCLDWLAGYLDADGCVTRDKNGNGLQISSTNRQFLYRLQMMLMRLGCQPKVVEGQPERWQLMPDGKGGEREYLCKPIWRLLIGNTDTYFLVKLGLNTNRLKIHGNPPQRDARRFVFVTGVENLEREEETFCVTEPVNNTCTFNGIVTGQCSEIILRPNEFCNLTEVVVRSGDGLNNLRNKVRLATILGTAQSTFTQFKYLRKVWQDNCNEERLLGVSLTGIYDNDAIHDPDTLAELRQVAIDTNKQWADELEINQSASITCVKPSGTVSQLVDSASGIHPRHSAYYIRRVRADVKDPLTDFLKHAGIPNEPDVMNEQNVVFSFPIKAPEAAKTRHDVSAIDQLKTWAKFQDAWCEHKPSCTVYVKEEEWCDVAAFTFRRFSSMSGVSFLPFDGGAYEQMPYEEIDITAYNSLLSQLPATIDWNAFSESDDETSGSQELACTADACEIVDIT